MLKLKQPDPDEVVEKANDLNAPLMPDNDDTGFRPLTEEEKENFTGSWRCAKCGLPMFLACIEPAVEVDCERRTFACSTCPYGETITVNFRIDRGDAVSLERARPWWDMDQPGPNNRAPSQCAIVATIG